MGLFDKFRKKEKSNDIKYIDITYGGLTKSNDVNLLKSVVRDVNDELDNRVIAFWRLVEIGEAKPVIESLENDIGLPYSEARKVKTGYVNMYNKAVVLKYRMDGRDDLADQLERELNLK